MFSVEVAAVASNLRAHGEVQRRQPEQCLRNLAQPRFRLRGLPVLDARMELVQRGAQAVRLSRRQLEPGDDVP